MNLKNINNILVKPDASLRDAIACIDNSGLKLALIAHENGCLAGILTDGDVRRAMLRNFDLSTPVSEVMNSKPITAHISTPIRELLVLMRRDVLHHIPLLDDNQKLVDVVTIDELSGLSERPNWVVLMAGGLGERLRPLTNDCPKPMLRIGGKPILESIVESFVDQGFRKFYLSVNYLAEAIQDYFGDGHRHGVEIRYLHEKKKLGTAGGLSLLPECPSNPLVVMNGDLLTRVRFDQMLCFHEEHASMATMAIREYNIQIPYGVVNVDGIRIASIDEKPLQRFFVNAGIYALSPEALRFIPADMAFDMPSLFEKLQASGQLTSGFPLREYWLDIGRLEDFERAQNEWSLHWSDQC